jgi:hypothetical protein
MSQRPRFPCSLRRCRLVAYIVALALGAAGASATPYTITDLGDDANFTNGTCQLREALRAAAMNAPVDACVAGTDDDVIELQTTGTYAWAHGAESLFGTGSILVHGAAGHPPGSYLVAVSTVGRFLRITSGTDVTLANFAVNGGDATTATPASGGCVYSESSDLTLVGMLFTSCSARVGGALEFVGTDRRLTIQGTTFSDNHVWESGGVQVNAGAVHVQVQGESAVRIEDSSFLLNDANTVATSGYVGALALYLSDTSTAVVRRTTFDQNKINAATNTSGYVAALYVSDLFSPDVDITLEDLLLTGNGVVGGNHFTGNVLALLASVAGTSRLTVSRVRIIGSSGPSDEGMQAQIQTGDDAVVRLDDVLVADGETQGLSIDAQHGTASILADHLTVTGHSVYGLRLFNFGDGPVRVQNSILFDNGTDIDIGSPATPVDVSAENSTDDPLFVDAASHDYQLQALSPAVDAGHKSFSGVGPYDALHRLRVVGAETDLGALERGGLFGDDLESGDLSEWSGVR